MATKPAGKSSSGSPGSNARIERRPFVAALMNLRKGTLVVPGLGSPTWDIFAAGDSPEYLYSWGGMGLALSTALGVALAQPKKRVLCLTGDGEMMMGIGSLAVVAAQARITAKRLNLTLKHIKKYESFLKEFNLTCDDLVENYSIAWVTIENPLEMYIFEPYCAMKLNTIEYNFFDTLQILSPKYSKQALNNESN